MIERNCVDKELSVVSSWIIQRKAVVNHLHDVMLEYVRLDNEGILAIALTCLVFAAAACHHFDDLKDLIDKLQTSVKLFVRDLLLSPVL